jgi:hypothetical protein
MANTIKLYLSRDYQADSMRQYWLAEETDYYDGQTADYKLPAGFAVAESAGGETLVYDNAHGGVAYRIGTAGRGTVPFLFAANCREREELEAKRVIFLKRA